MGLLKCAQLYTDDLPIGCITGIPWVLISITVTITVNTVPSTVTGKNPYQSYTVLYGNRTTVQCYMETILLYGVALELRY